MAIYYLLFILLVQSIVGAPTNPLGTVGIRSGLGWNSGILPVNRVSGRTSYQTELRRTETGRGRSNDVEHVYSWWDNNGGLQVMDWLDPAPMVTLIGYVPFPNSSNWANVANGVHDSVHFKSGQKIAASRPNVKTVVRIAYEFNGNWFYWKADSNFIAGFKRIRAQLKAGAGSQANNVLVAWCLAGLNNGAGYDFPNLYPGDDFVDIISIDTYDWPANFDQADFDYHSGHELDVLLQFAKDHNKPFGIDEWGLHHTAEQTNDGEDNPAFIHLMFNWFRSNKEWLAYEVYFQDDNPKNVDSSLFSALKNINPDSKAAYLQEMQWGTTAVGTTTKSATTKASTTGGGSNFPVILTATIDQSVISGTNKFTYSGSWNDCFGCNPTSSYQNGFKYAYTTGDSVTLTFVGVQAKIYGIKEEPSGIAQVSVDGEFQTEIDNYSPSSQVSLLYTSPVLSYGTHTIKLTISGKRSYEATGISLVIDKAEIFNADPNSISSTTGKAATTAKSSTTKASTTKGSTTKSSTTKGSTTKASTTKGSTTKISSTSSVSSSSSTTGLSLSLVATVDELISSGNNKFTFVGSSWNQCGGCNPPSYQNGFKYAYTTGDYVEVTFTGRQAKIYGIKEVPGGIASYSVDGGAAVDVDHYSSSSSASLLFTSPVLSSGTHVIKISVTGRKNSSATSSTISVDKLEVFN